MNHKELPTWLLPLLSWLFSAYFLISFHFNVNFSQPIPTIYYLFLILGVSLAFLPFMNKIKIGTLLELERQIKETKNEVKDFKEETRQMLSVISTNVNTIGNLSNTINISIPGMAQLSQAKEKLVQQSDPETLRESETIKDELSLESEDTIVALAKTRIKLESLLRKILGKRFKNASEITKNIKYASFRPLYRRFLKEYPDYTNLENSFTYVGQICNAAIHAQRVPEEQASEALDLGANLIALLNKIVKDQEDTID